MVFCHKLGMTDEIVTDSPRSVWDRWRNTCFLYEGPRYQMRAGVFCYIGFVIGFLGSFTFFTFVSVANYFSSQTVLLRNSLFYAKQFLYCDIP